MHINQITVKANHTLSLLQRNIKLAPTKTKELLCKSLVRPQLEYASTVWSPWQNILINSVENIQCFRHPCKFILKKQPLPDERNKLDFSSFTMIWQYTVVRSLSQNIILSMVKTIAPRGVYYLWQNLAWLHSSLAIFLLVGMDVRIAYTTSTGYSYVTAYE